MLVTVVTASFLCFHQTLGGLTAISTRVAFDVRMEWVCWRDHGMSGWLDDCWQVSFPSVEAVPGKAPWVLVCTSREGRGLALSEWDVLPPPPSQMCLSFADWLGDLRLVAKCWNFKRCPGLWIIVHWAFCVEVASETPDCVILLLSLSSFGFSKDNDVHVPESSRKMVMPPVSSNV